MQEDKGKIPVSLVRETLARAQAKGLDAQSLAAAAGIAPRTLASTHGRVSPAQYGALWNGMAQALDDEFLGQDSHPMRSGSFIAMAHGAITARNGDQALARMCGFMRLVLDDFGTSITREGERVRVTFRHRAGTPTPAMFAYATYFVLVYGLVCWLVGRRIPLLAARFGCAAPPAAQAYRQMFCDDIAFDQPVSYVELPAAFLALPVVQTSRTIKPFLRNAPGNFVVKYRNPGSLAARVRRALRTLPPLEWPGAAQMATRLRMAEATLRRHLKLEGYTYQSIKDELRRERAISLLADTRWSVAEIAAMLGFAEPSAFHRAFRKWTGRRPAEYRAAPPGLAAPA